MLPLTASQTAMRPDPLIVRLLRTLDSIDPDRLDSLWQSASVSAAAIEQQLIQSGLADEHQIAQAYARHYLLPVFDPPADSPLPIDPSVAKLLSHDLCRDNKLAPLAEDGDFLDVAVFAPDSLLLSEQIQTLTGRHMRPMFAPLSVIDRLHEILYCPAPDSACSRHDDFLDELGLSDPDPRHRAPRSDAVGDTIESSAFQPIEPPAPQPRVARQRASEKAFQQRPNRFLSELLDDAICRGATAVHIDTFDSSPRVRLRIHGKLIQRDAPSTLELHREMVGQIKRLGKLDRNANALASSGTIRLRRGGVCMDAVVHAIQTVSGEQLVLSLHSGTVVAKNLATIGLDDSQFDSLLTAMGQSRGLVLFAGPRRSGRTTTAYACLHWRNEPSASLCTIERRINERLPGAVQIELANNDVKSYSRALDACLGHECDVVLVDRIIDGTIAERCALAAYSRSLVLATTEAATSLQAIGQLRRFGVDDGLIAESLRMVVAQRLVRRLCTDCRRGERIEAESAERFGIPVGDIVFRPVGCQACHGAGYHGSVVIFDVLAIDSELTEAIAAGAPTGELAQKIRERGGRTHRDNAINLALAGDTSLDELNRAGLLD